MSDIREDPRAEIGRLLHETRLSGAARRPPARSLTAAATDGDAALVAAFLEAGSDIEERSIGFASPLQAVAGQGRMEMVSFLLARGADPHEKPDSVYSPLSASIMHGHVEVARRLMDAMDHLSSESQAVMSAAAHGQSEILDVLLGRGAPLGPHAGHTLRVAARAGQFACVQRLLAAGVDPRAHPDYAFDLFGEPVDEPFLPRQAALEAGHMHVAALLDGQTVDPSLVARVEEKRESPAQALGRLASALRGGQEDAAEPPPREGAERARAIERVLDLIRAGALAGQVDAHRRGDRPLLVLAAEGGHAAVVDALLAAGAAPDEPAADGDTALIAAARWGHGAVVARLLAAGAAVDARNAAKHTALMAAAERGDRDGVRRLLEAGSDPGLRVRGKSARGFAAGVYRRAIQDLIEAHAARRPAP